MKLSWYINRLRSMGPAEIVHRLLEKCRKAVSKRRHQSWSTYQGAQLHGVMPGLSERVRTASLSQRKAISVACAAILAGHYDALGCVWPQQPADMLFASDRWRLDPVTNTLWPGPQTYTFDIDFRQAGALGDIKYVWEFNRLQFLPVLAAQHLLAHDAASLQAVAAALESWHESNPPFGGIGWASGIEVAVRAINIALALEMVGDKLAQSTREKATQILSASAFWLKRFPSRFSSANNHLVAELAGETIIARALGQNDGGAWQQLLVELDRQILPDGAGAEQSPTYAAFTAELVMVASMAVGQAAVALPEAARDRLAALADFIAWIGPQATFGDNDEGRVVSLAHEVDYPASVAAAIAGVSGKALATAPFDDFRALILGGSVQARSLPVGMRTFEHGGLSVWRGEMSGRQVSLRFDHGPLGYLSIAAHGHADALAISLDIEGEPVLVDPGTYLYGSGGSWRTWFRSTPAHNTLNLCSQSQSIMSGAFNWSHKANAVLVSQQNAPGWSLLATHDGYERRFGARHQREVSSAEHSITLHDCLIGNAQDAEIVFQLAPGLDVVHDGTRVTIGRAKVPLLRIVLPSDGFSVSAGGAVPGQGGWVSNRFGSKVPAARIVWRGRVNAHGVQSVLTVL